MATGPLPTELERAFDDVVLSVHEELERRNRLPQAVQSSLGVVAELSESIGTAGAIAASVESDRVKGRVDPENHTQDGEPRWLDYRERLIDISVMALEACYLHAIHPEPSERGDASDAEYVLALGYWAVREAFAARGETLAIAEWQLALVSTFGEAAALLELAHSGIDAAESVKLPESEEPSREVTPSFAIGQVAVRFLGLAGLAMLGASALTQDR